MILLPFSIPELQVGVTSTIQKKITSKDTAKYYGSGELNDLLPIPVLTAVMIEAAVQAVDPLLPDGFTTAGRYTEFTHSQPTVSGMTLTVTAELTYIDGHALRFTVVAYDELGQIGEGVHERTIINKEAFFNRVKKRVATVLD